MILDQNPLVNWLRFCRFMTLGRFMAIIGIIMWGVVFFDGMSEVGFLIEKQIKHCQSLRLFLLLLGFLLLL